MRGERRERGCRAISDPTDGRLSMASSPLQFPALFPRRRVSGQNQMLTFRIAITAAVMAFVTALTACLIFIQIATFHAAAKAAASAAMDAASANTLGRLVADLSELSTLVRVLSASPFLSDSNDRSEADGVVGLFKAALQKLPQTDSL